MDNAHSTGKWIKYIFLVSFLSPHTKGRVWQLLFRTLSAPRVQIVHGIFEVTHWRSGLEIKMEIHCHADKVRIFRHLSHPSSLPQNNPMGMKIPCVRVRTIVLSSKMASGTSIHRRHRSTNTRKHLLACPHYSPAHLAKTWRFKRWSIMWR